ARAAARCGRPDTRRLNRWLSKFTVPRTSDERVLLVLHVAPSEARGARECGLFADRSTGGNK
ncbi:jg13495, partial [Pararge aegeria aegeria]